MTTKIYWSSIEYKYDKKAIESKDLKGGFVYAFIKAKDIRDALENLLNELKLQSLVPVEIEFMKPYDLEIEWETPEKTKHYQDLFDEAKKSTNVIFDKFYAFEKYK